MSAPVTRAAGSPRTTLDQVWSILRPQRALLWAIGVAVLAGAVLETAPPLIMGRIIDGYLVARRAEGLLALGALYLGASAAVQGVGFIAQYWIAVAAQRALRALRVRLFAHLQRLPITYYDQTPLGDVISRCTADIETVDTLFTSGIAHLFADLLRLSTVLVAMLVLSRGLTALALLALPPTVISSNYFRVRVRNAERANRIAIGRLNSQLQETLSGVEIVRAFDWQARLVVRFRQALAQALRAFNAATIPNAIYTPVMTMLSAAAVAALLWAGTLPFATTWRLSVGTITAFALLYRRFFAPVISLGDEWQTVQSALSGAERVFDVLALPVELPGAPAAADARAESNRDAMVEFEGVTFGYLPGTPVLEDVSFRVRPGEQVALVGRTGAGKSSVLGLVSGLYTPWQGTVCVAGRSPLEMDDAERGRILGVVPQAVQLFSGTITENLTLGQEIAFEQVRTAAEIAGADEFIRALPAGYDTVLGGRGGVQLSAGQRQLLALTRALVRCPAVLLLDEATAAIDSASEAAFRAALRRSQSREGQALLLVAHRLSTAREADRVIVLDRGRIIEEGPPDELVQRGGHFAALLELEAAGWDWRNSGVAEL